MKRHYLIVCLLAIVAVSCKQKTEEKESCCKKDMTESTTPVASSDESIFNVESTWQTQDNQSVKLSSLKGKVLVMAMIFSNCQSACPRIISDLQRIEASIPKDKINEVQFVLVSMDPLRDTPKRLKEFSKEHGLDEKRYVLLTSNENDALEFANVIGVKYKKTEDGGFDHSNIIHILDRNGVIQYQQKGLAQEPKESLEKINELLK